MVAAIRWLRRADRSPVATATPFTSWAQAGLLRGKPPQRSLRATVFCVVSLLWLMSPLLSSRSSWGEPGNVHTFWAAVDNAQARSPILQRQAAILRAAQETDSQSLAKLLPTVSVLASKTLDDTTRYHQARTTTRNEPTQVGLSVTQPIFNYTNLLGREQSLPHIEAAVADLAFSRQEVVVRTATLASNWLEAREVYELSVQYAQVTARHAHVVGLRFKAGESTETEVHEAESRAAQAVASQVNARNVMDKAAVSFAEVVGEPPAPTLMLPEFHWQDPAQFEARLPEFVEARADIRGARARMQESEITTRMRRSEHAPSVRFTYTATHTWDTEMGGSSGRSLKEDTDTQTSMVLLDVPIFNGGAVLSRTRQAQAEWESQVADVDRLRLLAVRETQEARMDMANLQAAIVAQEKALQYSQKALTGLQESFLAGTRTILELLDAQYEVLTIQTNLVRSRYQHRLARIRFWAALGWPLVPEPPLPVVVESGLLAVPVAPVPRPTSPVAPVQEAKPVQAAVASPAVPSSPPPAASPAPVSAYNTQPVLPEAGRRPEGVVQEAEGYQVVQAGTRVVANSAGLLPKMGFGPYFVCVGLYPDLADLRAVEQTLAEQGIPTILETIRPRGEGSELFRLLVGPFADFTDTQQARRQVEVWTSGLTGWIRNRYWPPAVEPLPQDASSLTASGPYYRSEPLRSTVADASTFQSSGPFFAELPRTPEPLSPGGPLYPHLSEGPFYIHLGAFLTEEAREVVRQQIADLRLLDPEQVQGGELLLARRDTVRSADGRFLHRLLLGPFESYEKGLQARRAIQKATGIQTGWVDNPRWEEHQHCPSRSALQAVVPEMDGYWGRVDAVHGITEGVSGNMNDGMHEGTGR